MNGDWRVFRPAIWLAMIGIALLLILHTPYVGAVVLGASIGTGLRIERRRRAIRRGGQSIQRGRRSSPRRRR